MTKTGSYRCKNNVGHTANAAIDQCYQNWTFPDQMKSKNVTKDEVKDSDWPVCAKQNVTQSPLECFFLRGLSFPNLSVDYFPP